MARKDSITKKIIRAINTLILISFVLVALAVLLENVTFKICSLIITTIPAIWLFSFFIKTFMKDTCLFYLDDDKEKDKEKEFKVTVNFIVSVFIFSAAFVMMITVSESIGENKYFLNINDLNLNTGIKIGSFYTVFLVVNALFSISLHQPLYINSLTLDIPNILYNMKGQDSEENIKKVRRYSQGRFLKL